MKKMMKKIALIMSCVMMTGMLAGCAKFDASAYLAALLDNSYKNDSTALVELGIGTEEEAAAIYEQGLDTEMQALTSTAGISADQVEGLRDVIADMLAGAKYTVGEAEAQDDGSYVVTVTYEQMKVFGPTIDNYMAETEALVAEWTEAALAGEEVASEDELMAEVIGLFETVLADAVANATYDAPQTTTVRIEKVDNAYQPNTEDLTNLEYLLFDSDTAFQ